MNIKKILSRKSEIRPGKDFDKKFWNKFDDEFEKEGRKIHSWLVGSVLAAMAVFAMVVFVAPPFEDNFKSKLTAEQIDEIVNEMIAMNSYVDDNLDVDVAIDYENFSEL